MPYRLSLGTLVLFFTLCVVFPVEASGKDRKVPEHYRFNIQVRDALTRRPIGHALIRISADEAKPESKRTAISLGGAVKGGVSVNGAKPQNGRTSVALGAPEGLNINFEDIIGKQAGETDKAANTSLEQLESGGFHDPQASNVVGFTNKNGEAEPVISSGAERYIINVSFEANKDDRQLLREYEPERVEYVINDKYQKTHHIGPVYLKIKRNVELNEVSVTPTKVMFYYKGDTLIYNADAFVLAEGSMLDGLISQMPGVELKRNGEIKVNGKAVSTLLLNGKDLFNGNNQLMLENLAAYTVKDIAVYNKTGFDSEALGINAGDTRYVMDVRLKREYLHGFLGNVSGGYGTDNRYLAKLFGMWYSENVGMTAFLSSNNLNDDARPKPGYSDGSWSDLTPSAGTGSYHSGGITYNAEGAESKWKVNGDAMVRYTDGTVSQTQNTAVLIPGSEMFEHRWNNALNKDFRVNSSHSLKLALAKRAVFTLSPTVEYSRYRSESSDVSATFNHEVNDISNRIIENIYSNNSEFSQYLLNRDLTQSLDRRNNFSLTVDGRSMIRLHPDDGRTMMTVGAVADIKNQQLDNYTYRRLDFTAMPDNGRSTMQHNDLTPDRDRLYRGYVKLNRAIDALHMNLGVTYDFTRNEQVRSSQFYQGELMRDFLTPSQLPHHSIDLPLIAGESYRSSQWENRHTLTPVVNFKWEWAPRKRLTFEFNVPLVLSQRALDYRRGGNDQYIASTRFLPEFKGSLSFYRYNNARNYNLLAGFSSSAKQPQLLNMADVIDGTDPMNISLGNPDLAHSRTNTASLYINISGGGPQHTLAMTYTTINNAISQGAYYMGRTGRRISRPYNVNGNRNADVSYTISRSKNETMAVSNTLSGQYRRSCELIGVVTTDDNPGADLDATVVPPPVNRVDNYALSDRIDLHMNFKERYSIKVFADLGIRKYRSTNASFGSDLTFNGSYGASAILNLPRNWGQSTDLTLYTRRGYLDSRLNTTDVLWNGRVTKSFLKGSLVCAIEGYDLLRQLSNVSYTVNAQYRTETVTNVIPAYVLLSVQFRFNKQPKR